MTINQSVVAGLILSIKHGKHENLLVPLKNTSCIIFQMTDITH